MLCHNLSFSGTEFNNQREKKSVILSCSALLSVSFEGGISSFKKYDYYTMRYNLYFVVEGQHVETYS
jgi:hypothetical protein